MSVTVRLATESYIDLSAVTAWCRHNRMIRCRPCCNLRITAPDQAELLYRTPWSRAHSVCLRCGGVCGVVIRDESMSGIPMGIPMGIGSTVLVECEWNEK